MDDFQKRVEADLRDARSERKDLLNTLHSINVQVAKNSVSLEDHMRRTDANEARLKQLEKLKWYFGALMAISVIVARLLERII